MHFQTGVTYKGWAIESPGQNDLWEAVNVDVGEIIGADTLDALHKKIDDLNGEWADRHHWYTRGRG